MRLRLPYGPMTRMPTNGTRKLLHALLPRARLSVSQISAIHRPVAPASGTVPDCAPIQAGELPSAPFLVNGIVPLVPAVTDTVREYDCGVRSPPLSFARAARTDLGRWSPSTAGARWLVHLTAHAR